MTKRRCSECLGHMPFNIMNNKLTEKQKFEILKLKCLKFKIREISTLLNISSGTIKYWSAKFSENLTVEDIKLFLVEQQIKNKNNINLVAKHNSIVALEKLLSNDFNKLCFDSKRKRIIIEQENKCKKCNIDRWLDAPIVLEIDHIDGNRENNIRENLEAICPNCHSLTETWRGRNKKESRKTNQLSDEELLKILSKHKNIRQALMSAGLAAKGKNYQRARKLLGC